ncbi:MAG: sarcosine oxidase subunit gamma [Paracoccaceae bacterium]
MVKLLAKTPCEGLLPVSVGNCTLSELTPDAITSIAPARGQIRAVSAALKKMHGLGFPRANRATGTASARCIWFGPGQAMLLGPVCGLTRDAAITDQSDGWAVMRLQGAGAQSVSARLVPVDLRARIFKRGHTARTQLFHVPVSITRTGANRFDIMVFRSMAVTAVDELTQVMKSIAAQENGGA